MLKRFVPSLLLAAPLVLAPCASFADLLLVEQNKQKGTRDCGGGDARIDGNANKLAFRNCAKIIVAGNANEIDAGSVASLVLYGNENKVSWVGEAPHVSDSGSRNVVSKLGGLAGTVATAQAGAADATAKVKIDPTNVGIEAGGSHVSVGPGGVSIGGEGGSLNVDPTGVTVGGASVSRVAITQDGSRRTYDCKGEHASVSGNRNVLTFRNCTAVNVSGDENEIFAGTAARLNISGDRNRVHHPAGISPAVSDTGNDNEISEDQ